MSASPLGRAGPQATTPRDWGAVGISLHEVFITRYFVLWEVLPPALHQAVLFQDSQVLGLPPPGAHPRSLCPQMLLLVYSLTPSSRATWGKCLNIVYPDIPCSYQPLDKRGGMGATTVWKMPEAHLRSGRSTTQETSATPSPPLPMESGDPKVWVGEGPPPQLSPDPGTLLQDGPPGTGQCCSCGAVSPGGLEVSCPKALEKLRVPLPEYRHQARSESQGKWRNESCLQIHTLATLTAASPSTLSRRWKVFGTAW